MRIRSVHLHPFAGIRDKTYEFKESLAVLLGPNESGKSTVFQAVIHGLLTTTSLTATKVESEMGSYFPAVGGDVIRVDLELTVNDNETVHIRKNWKKGNRDSSASLKLPDGTEITDEEKVQRRIEALLPVSPATLRTIMLADQSGLHRTMREMEKEDRVRKELGDLLRKNFMETSGVSVDRFKELLNQKYEEYFKKWEREQQYPENNRGIKNPYKGGIGKVVDAFYKKEQLIVDMKEARRFEDGLDAVNEELTSLFSQQEEKKEKFGKLNPLKEGIQKRQLKEQQLDAANERRERLLEVSRKWPVFEDKIQNLEPEVKGKEEEIKKLEREQKHARNKQKTEQLKQQIEKIEQLSQKVEKAKDELKDAHKVEEEDLKKLRELQNNIQQFRTKIESAKLTVRIESDYDRTLRYSEAGKEEQQIQATGSKSIEQTAAGGFSLQTDGLQVWVFSGEGDLEQTVQDLKAKENELSNHLKELEVESIQDAESYAELYRQKQHDLKQAENSYKSELGDRDLKELKEELEAYGDLSKVRSSGEISDDLVTAKTELNELKKRAEEAESKLKEWKERYNSFDEVSLKQGDTSRSIKDLEEVLETLPSLPDEYESSEEFIEEVNQLNQRLDKLKDQIFEKKQERTELEGKAPDTSFEELEKLFEEAEAEFDGTNNQAETLARVREKALDLIESMDSDTYKGLETSFVKWLELMVGKRFSAVDLDNDMPATFKTQDATSLTYDLLSHGTKDTVALAWRFALCEKFLDDESGFVILDDPMVDIDPDRRKEVVKAIKEFTERYQAIVMTCHPDHAVELIGEEEIVSIT